MNTTATTTRPPVPAPALGFWRTRRLPILLQTEAAECGLA
jgi:hypothetical protein